MPVIWDDQAVSEISDLDWQLAYAQAPESLRSSGRLSREDDRSISDPMPPERLKLARAGIRHLSSVIHQLVELHREDGDDEYGVLRANDRAFDVACQLLIDAAIAAAREGRAIPYGCASTDGEGGVRIEWVRADRGVHLVVPASSGQDAYIYHEVGTDYATESATPEGLARWLSEIE